MWLGLPLAGMAASVALAMGVTTLLRQGVPQQGHGAATYTAAAVHPGTPKAAAAATPASQSPLMASAVPLVHRNISDAISTHRNSKRTIIKDQNNLVAVADNSGFHIRLRDVAPAAAPQAKLLGTFNSSVNTTTKSNTSTPQRKKIELVDAGYKTFLPDEVNPQRPSRFSVILSGGVNKGNHNNGFMAGATVRRMINEKVFVEGEVAFTGSSNTQSTSYFEQTSPGMPVAMGKINPLTASTTAAKTLSDDMPDATPVPIGPTGVIKQKDVSYNLYYAAVNPSIGYKIINRLSVSAGPDFQKALADNRPAPSTVDRGTIQVAPLFDVGMVGKTECAITKQVKAGIAYRKGINNVLTPMGKYIDRDYVQFQIKWAILNK
jgi:hypothetical protein